MMLTGDYHYTAIAVARGVGMLTPEAQLVIIQARSELASPAQPAATQARWTQSRHILTSSSCSVASHGNDPGKPEVNAISAMQYPGSTRCDTVSVTQHPESMTAGTVSVAQLPGTTGSEDPSLSFLAFERSSAVPSSPQGSALQKLSQQSSQGRSFREVSLQQLTPQQLLAEQQPVQHLLTQQLEMAAAAAAAPAAAAELAQDHQSTQNLQSCQQQQPSPSKQSPQEQSAQQQPSLSQQLPQEQSAQQQPSLKQQLPQEQSAQQQSCQEQLSETSLYGGGCRLDMAELGSACLQMADRLQRSSCSGLSFMLQSEDKEEELDPQRAMTDLAQVGCLCKQCEAIEQGNADCDMKRVVDDCPMD